jgi:Double zinc ribbon
VAAHLQPNTSDVCPSCGRPLGAGAKFCRGCGKPVGQPPPTETADTCPSCGAAHKAGAKFCGTCGFRFGATTEPAISREHLPQPGTEPQGSKTHYPAQASEVAPFSGREGAEAAVAVVAGRVCPSCGTEYAAAKAFCRNCGSPLVPVEAKPSPPVAPSRAAQEGSPSAATSLPKEAPTVVRCATCGTEVPPGKKFCRSCGAPVGVSPGPVPAGPRILPVAPEPVSTQPPFPPAAPPAEAVAEPTAPMGAKPAGGPATAPSIPPRWGALRIAIVLGCIAMVGGGGFLAYRHFRPNRRLAPAGSATSQPSSGAGAASANKLPPSAASSAGPATTAPPQAAQATGAPGAASGNPPSGAAGVQGGTAPLPPTSRPVPAPPLGLTTPVKNPAGSGLGAAGGIASPASPAAGASGYPSAGIAAPANNRSGGAGAGVAAPAIVNPSPTPTPPPLVVKPTPPPPPQPVNVLIPAGTSVVVTTIDPVDSETNHAGDIFRASLGESIVVNNQIVVPQGTEISLRALEIRSASNSHSLTEVRLVLHRLEYHGHTYLFNSSEFDRDSPGPRQIQITPGTRITFQLQDPVTVTYMPGSGSRQ